MKPSWSLFTSSLLGVSAGVGLAYWQAASSRPAAMPYLPMSTEPQHTGTGSAAAETLALPSSRPADPALAAEWDFLEKLRGAAAGEMAVLWEESGTTDEGRHRRRVILERWVELDPAAAAAAMRGRYEWIPVVYAAWFTRDPKAALAAAKKEEGEFYYTAFNGLWSAAQHDPAQFFRLAEDEPEMFGKLAYTALTERGIRELLAFSEKKTLALVEKMNDSTREQVMAVLVENLAATDMDAAISRVKESKTSGMAYHTATALMPTLMEQDWQKAGEVLRGLEIKEDMFDLSWALLPKLREQMLADPKQAVEWINTNLAQNDWTRRNLLIQLSSELLLTHPEIALQLREQDAFGRSLSLYRTFPPGGDPAALLTAAASAPVSAFRDQVVDHYLPRWVAENPAAARAWVESLGEAEFKTRAQVALDHSGEDGLQRTFAGTLASLRQHPENAGFQNLAATTAMEIAYIDPALAVAKAAELPPGKARDEAMAKVAAAAALSTSPREALDWIAALPNEADQLAALPAMAKVWAGDDPPAVSEWLALQERGPLRDAAVAAFAENVWEVEPEAAVLWAASMEDGAQRSATLEKILPGVLGRDSELAQAILQKATLTPEERAHWQSYQPTPSPKK